MVNGFEDSVQAPIEPPAVKPACGCTLQDLSISIETIIDKVAESMGLEWKGRVGHKITDDIERVLDDYYTFGTCTECAPDEEARS